MKSTSGIARFLTILAATMFVAGLLQVAYAQGRGMQPPAQRAEQLGKQLSLDSVTVAKIADIYTKSQKLMSDKRAELQGDQDGMRAAMMALRDSTNKWITALLTKDQAKKFEDFLKEQQQRRQRAN